MVPATALRITIYDIYMYRAVMFPIELFMPRTDLRFVDVQAVSAIFGIGKSRSCGVDAVLPCSGKPVAGTWRCHVTVAVNK